MVFPFIYLEHLVLHVKYLTLVIHVEYLILECIWFRIIRLSKVNSMLNIIQMCTFRRNCFKKLYFQIALLFATKILQSAVIVLQSMQGKLWIIYKIITWIVFIAGKTQIIG